MKKMVENMDAVSYGFIFTYDGSGEIDLLIDCDDIVLTLSVLTFITAV